MIPQILEGLMDWLFRRRRDIKRRILMIAAAAILSSVSFLASGNLQPRENPALWIYPPPVRSTIVRTYLKENLFKWFPPERSPAEIAACYALAFSGWLLGGFGLYLLFPVLATILAAPLGLDRDAIYARIRGSLRQAGREEASRLDKTLAIVAEELGRQRDLPALEDPQWESYIRNGRYPQKLLPALVPLIQKHALLGSQEANIPRSTEYAPNMLASSLSLLPLAVRGAAFAALAELTAMSFTVNADFLNSGPQGMNICLAFSAADILARMLHMMPTIETASRVQDLIRNEVVLLRIEEAELFVVKDL